MFLVISENIAFLCYIIIGLDIKKNNAIQTLESWGPDFKVEFSISVVNIPDGTKEYNILHITDDQNNYHNLLVSVKNETLHISSMDENFLFEYHYEIAYEYNIIIQQTGKSKVNPCYARTYYRIMFVSCNEV